MDALANAAEEAAKAAAEEVESLEQKDDDKEKDYEDETEEEEDEVAQHVEVDKIIVENVESDENDDLVEASPVEDYDNDYEINDLSLATWAEMKLFQVKNTCCAGSFCLMKGVSVPLAQEASRCCACGCASHLSCQVQLKDADDKLCRLCAKTEKMGRRVEVETSDELQQEISKKKRKLKLEFVSRKKFNELCMEYEDGFHDEMDGSTGKLFVE